MSGVSQSLEARFSHQGSPAHSAPLPSRRIAAYDGLRGVCALMVLFHHLLLTQPVFADHEWGRPLSHDWGLAGWLLVATPLHLLWSGQARALLFFVLSGFVLGLPWLERHRARYGRYLLGRFCRIYPPYLCAMVLAAFGSTILGGHPLPAASVYVRDLGWVFEPTWAAVPSIGAMLDNHSSEFMNEAVWSLVWEVRVALIFPLLMIPVVRWGNAAIVPLLLVLLLASKAAGLLIGPQVASVLNAPQETFHYAEFFVFGIAVALNRGRLSSLAARRGNRPGLGLFVVGCLICWAPWPFEHDGMVGVGAAIVLASILASPLLQRKLAWPPLLRLGRQSYSLYLIHVPVIMAAVTLGDGVVRPPVLLIIAPACIAAAALFHRWVEMPSVAFTQAVTGFASRSKA